MPHPFFELPGPWNIAHRGASDEAPENTYLAFERARDAGAVALESDVRSTADGVPVLFHDDALERTTDGAGRLAALRWSEVRDLDAGYRFERDGRFPFRGRGHRPLSVEEAFAAFHELRFNLEVKESDPELIDRLLDLVARAGRAGRTLLTAEDDRTMARIRERSASRDVGVAWGASEGDVRAYLECVERDAPPPREAMALQVPVEHDGVCIVDHDLLRHTRRHGVPVHVWTINDRVEMTRLLDQGVDGIVTDRPALLRAVLAARSASI